MLWLDNFLSVPGLGIRIRPNYQLIPDFQERLTSFINYISGEYEDLEIKQLDIWGYSIREKKSGFFFEISPKNIYFHFAYRISERPQPAKLPIYDMPTISNYSELLEKVCKHMDNLLEILKDLKGINYDRVGIVADANLNKESLPPGISLWIETLSKPWNGQLIKTETTLLSKLAEKDAYNDQCHHYISFDDSDPEQGYRLKLDWQRMFKEPNLLEYKKSLDTVASCKEEALNYFEKFGEGDLSYD
jgi:hypothetical protein